MNMKQLLSSPMKMNLSEVDNSRYQSVLKLLTDISLNLMAVKTEQQAKDFHHWNSILLDICLYQLDFELLEKAQYPILLECIEHLHNNCLVGQLKMLRVTPWALFETQLDEKSARIESQLELLKKSANLSLCGVNNATSVQKNWLYGKSTAECDGSALPSFKNSRNFISYVTNHTDKVDQVLSLIPLTGEVTTADFNAFVALYKKTYCQATGAKNAPLYPATRLLALHRPDLFVCLSATNAELYSAAFATDKLSSDSFDVYWNQLITGIKASAFWRAEMPQESEQGKTYWRFRVALIDIFLANEFAAKKDNNYYRAMIAPQPKKIKKPAKTVVRKPKLSVEEQVDAALAADDVSPFVKSQKDAIIAQVKQGKKTDQVIALMQSIFS